MQLWKPAGFSPHFVSDGHWQQKIVKGIRGLLIQEIRGPDYLLIYC